jgi:5'-methylthioadenosine phosphorylase
VALGFIAGTGFEHLLPTDDRRRIATPFGRFDYLVAKLRGHTVIVIPRHGFSHEYSPFRMPTKAHLFGLRSLGVRRVVAASSVASANEAMQPGDLIIPDQFIDLTKSRDQTFYHYDVTVHTDMTEPFCGSLRARLYAACAKKGVRIHDRAVYAATEGPRYETPAEIQMIRTLGGDLVGQSAVQEAVLARELGICYALLAVVSSRAAGLQKKKDSRDILDSIWSRAEPLRGLLRGALPKAAAAPRRERCRENAFDAERLYQLLIQDAKKRRDEQA